MRPSAGAAIFTSAPSRATRTVSSMVKRAVPTSNVSAMLGRVAAANPDNIAPYATPRFSPHHGRGAAGFAAERWRNAL